MNESDIWTEKYRPIIFEEVVGQQEIVKRVKSLVQGMNIPHLLFAGPAGTGKSTLALIIVRQLFGHNWRENYLELNASVSKNTPILVKVDNKIKRTTFEELDKVYFKKINDKSSKKTDNLEVLTSDNNYKTKWAKTSQIIRHKVNKILKVHVEGGGIIELTGNHSIMLLGENGLYSKKASEIKTGDYFLSFVSQLHGTSKHLDLTEFHPLDKTSRVEVIDEIPLTNSTAWALGLYTAEGAIGFRNGTSGQTIYTLANHETQFIQKIEDFAKYLKINIYQNLTSSGFDRSKLSATQLRLLNTQLAKFIKNNFYDGEGHRAGNKIIPNFIYDSNLSDREEYLKGLSDGDGSGDWNNVVRISSVSNKLLTDVNWLARISGIESSIFKKEARLIWKGRMNWKKSDLIQSDIIINLLNKIENKINYNWKYELRHQLYEKKERISKRFIVKILENINKDNLTEIEEKIVETLRKLASSDLYPVKVKKIEIVDYDDYVYDVSVPNNETFFAGNIPILLHNSDERGIDVVRQKVKDFARTKAIGNVPFKVIFLDEADALTKEAQQALRRTMENYSNTCRFIMSCNYSSRIIDPIQSRCVIFRFKLLEKKDISSVIKKIADNEKITMSPDSFETLYELSEGDCRRAINLLQATSAISLSINSDILQMISSSTKPADIKVVLDYALAGDFVNARDKLLDVMLKESVSGVDIIKAIQKEIWNLQIEPEIKVKLTEKTGEAEFRMIEGSDEFVQLQSLLASFVLAGQGKSS